MDLITIVVFVLFLLFCGIMTFAAYTKPIPPEDSDKKAKQDEKN
jgi:hypothetical protein